MFNAKHYNFNNLLIALLFIFASGHASHAAILSYSFTSQGNNSGSFTYDNSVPTNGQIPYGQGGSSYAGLSFEVNGITILNPIIQIFDNYQSQHDIVYFTSTTGGPAVQLWGDATTISSQNLSELDNIELSDFSNTPKNTLYLGVYPTSPTSLTSFSSSSAAVPEPSSVALIGLCTIGLVLSRKCRSTKRKK